MKAITILIVSAFLSFTCSGQIRVDNTKSAEYYIKNVFLGPGIEVGQIKYIGMIGGLGQFEADPKIIGVKSGLVLSTGNADSIKGPNNSNGYTSWGKFPDSKQLIRTLSKGDRDLNRLCKGKTKDITVIEFDFVPIKNILVYNYIFASEEYTEYVGSTFNDVFGFYLSGPGIKKKINLAVLKDGKTPVSVNSINHKTNKNYYRKNSYKTNFIKKIFTGKNKRAEMEALRNQLQFDGLTTVLTVHRDVIPYQKYHIKIAIGDVSDNIYDSGVFLEAGSFVSIRDSTGKYFEELKKINSDNPPDIDSILKFGFPVDTIVPTPINQNFEITDIYFNQDSHTLPDSSKIQLDSLAQYLLSESKFNCTLYGYTDNVGSKEYNQELSEKRAIGVINYLVSKGVKRSRLDSVGRNFENPKSDNITDDGRAKNRRVEIIIEEN